MENQMEKKTKKGMEKQGEIGILCVCVCVFF